jgi:hypothetical protein
MANGPIQPRRYGSMWKRWCIRLVLAGVCAILILAVCSDRTTVAEFKCGEQCRLVLYTPTYYDVSVPIYYQVYSHGKLVVPDTLCYTRNPQTPMPIFRLVRAGTLVGVVANDRRHDLLVIYDTSSREAWPYVKSHERFPAEELRRVKLLAAFNANSKDGRFKAGG